jgi:hypothetical protein
MPALVLLMSLLAVGLVSWRWGADTRGSREWQWRCCG